MTVYNDIIGALSAFPDDPAYRLYVVHDSAADETRYVWGRNPIIAAGEACEQLGFTASQVEKMDLEDIIIQVAQLDKAELATLMRVIGCVPIRRKK